jgi:hypothetical protein
MLTTTHTRKVVKELLSESKHADDDKVIDEISAMIVCRYPVSISFDLTNFCRMMSKGGIEKITPLMIIKSATAYFGGLETVRTIKANNVADCNGKTIHDRGARIEEIKRKSEQFEKSIKK